jgi:protease-4
MGTVAASGGYWISTASDEIWASKDTITGSIGIFGMFPTYQKPLEKHAGIRVDGVGTSWMAGAFRPDRAMDPRLGQTIQAIIDQGYEEFLSRVGEARGMSREEVDKIARGRVWSGEDAHGLGLVDQLGGLQEAIASAANLAELGEDYQVKYLEKELSFTDQLMANMLSQVAGLVGPDIPNQPSLLDTFTGFLRREAEMLSSFNDPSGMYAHCMCEIE